MDKQILSLAIAVPTILLSALPSLANPVKLNQVEIQNLPITSVNPSENPVPVEGATTNPIDNVIVPGPNGVQPKGPKGPRPPRRDEFFNINNVLSQPGANVNPAVVNQNQSTPGY
ncbi:hypothetical protein [Tolypothrix tenuis]